VKFRLLGASGLRVSEASLGTATFCVEGWGSDPEESAKIFNAYLEAGGRSIDVSNTYADGRAEALVGKLARGRRDELVIGTKFTASTRLGDPNAWGNHRKSLRQSLHTSLERLQTDYVDIMWMHCWDTITPLDEIMRALDDEVRAGTILYIGVSNSPAWAIARANTMAELRGWTAFVGLQTEYSLVSRTPEHELIPMAAHLGIQVHAWSPLGGGLLSGGYTGQQVSGTRLDPATIPSRRLAIAADVAGIAAGLGLPPAAVALGWLRARPIPVIPILGARTLTQFEECLRWLEQDLPGSAVASLDEMSAPPPVMPREGLDMPGVDFYFDGGAGDELLVR
jgi:aryl-alcohol dehydrogenase-like predicted oxidoreductase